MEKFEISKCLVSLTKICIEEIQYQIRVKHIIFEAFKINTGLKQGDSLTPTLFNIASFENLLWKLKEKQREKKSENITYRYLDLQTT